eukprot:COSAG01_NODE_3663_length_5815_cov_10.892932_5_plen_73_part_01
MATDAHHLAVASLLAFLDTLLGHGGKPQPQLWLGRRPTSPWHYVSIRYTSPSKTKYYDLSLRSDHTRHTVANA